MPLELSSTAIQEKNKLSGGSAFHVALKIVVPGLSEPIRVISDNVNLTWLGETWVAFPFEIEEITDQAKGEIPRVDLRVANVNGIMGAYLADYDNYTKANGYTPVEVTIYVVNLAVITADPNADPEVEYQLLLTQPKAGPKWATFTLGAPNIYARRVPLNRILKNHCRFRFKDDRCGYTGEETACAKTLAACRTLGNAARFGGAPGVGSGGIVVE